MTFFDLQNWVPGVLAHLDGSFILMGLVGLGVLLGLLWGAWCFFLSETRLVAGTDGEASSALKGRRLILRALEGDELGAVSERLRGLFAREFVSRFWRRRSSEAQLVVGDTSVEPQEGLCSQNGKLDVTVQGRVVGHQLEVTFYPSQPAPPPLSQEDDDVVPISGVLAPVSSLAGRDGAPLAGLCFECFDFPLTDFKGLTRALPDLQSEMLVVAAQGVLARGIGLSAAGLPLARLLSAAERFEAALPQLRLTQAVLYQEMRVVTAWCLMRVGLARRDETCLTRALLHFDRILTFDWRSRDAVVWAGIKSNEALTALALAQLSQSKTIAPFLVDGEGGRAPLSDCEMAGFQRSYQAAAGALQVFRRETFPSCWGRLLALMGLSGAVLSALPNRGALAFEFQGHELDGFLDEVIGFWEPVGRGDDLISHREDMMPGEGQTQTALDGGIVAEATFAKGALLASMAQSEAGLQDWELAETAFLEALARMDGLRGWWFGTAEDVHFELGRLYFTWGGLFGDPRPLEKALHHFQTLSDVSWGRGGKALAVGLNLARCTLTYGGVTNEAAPLRLALKRFQALDAHCVAFEGAGIDRCIAVARARLALLERDCVVGRRAVSEISAVVGQRAEGFPSKALLLRLRSRLKELLFVLEGERFALDQAIVDRRRLVKIADLGMSHVHWAVEVGELVGLLSRRQYQVTARKRDFHEAHYLLEKALARCGSADKDAPQQFTGQLRHVRAGLCLKLGRLLASFARMEHDLSAFHEALASYEKYLLYSQHDEAGPERGEVLNEMGQIYMDCSTHYGQHEGLLKAGACFAEAFDIFLRANHMDQANRMRRFMDHAAASLLAYQGGGEVKAPPVS